jgi:Xaa-Pro aminopeptidase
MRYATIENSFFLQHRKNLVQLLKPGSIALLFSNYKMPRNGDQYYTYRQQSDFFYLSGIEQEKSVLLLAPDTPRNDEKEILFIIKSDPVLETWEGHKLTKSEATQISGVKNVKYIEEFEPLLHMLIHNSENIYLNLPEIPKFLPEVKIKNEIFAIQLKEKYPFTQIRAVSANSSTTELKKSLLKLDLIKKAIGITRNAFLKVLQSLKQA